jgi:hypothetical protein
MDFRWTERRQCHFDRQKGENMKKVLITLIALITVCLLAGQDTPNFSGTWIMDRVKSDAVGGRPGTGGAKPMEISLLIKHEGKSLFITRKLSRGDQELSEEFRYTTDGAENRNPGMGLGGQDVISKSRWEGKKLVTEWSQTRTTMEGQATMKTKETRSLSDDGKVLTIETTNSLVQRGEFVGKQIFNKK